MTPEQEKIGEEIIRLHKSGNGHLNWTVLYAEKSLFPNILDSEENWRQQEYIMEILVEHGLIKVINATGNQTRLTQKGFDFKSFKKARTGEKIKSFPQRYWWAVGLVAYFGGVFSVPIRDMIFRNSSPDTNQSKPTIPKDGHNPEKLPDTVSYKHFDKLNQTKK